MPRACTLCQRSDRAEVDEQLAKLGADGISLRSIAARFGTSTGTLRRHQEHVIKGYAVELGNVLAPARQRPDPLEIQGDVLSAVGDVLSLKDRAMRALDAAERAEKDTAAVMWFREVRSCLELLCKIRLAEAQYPPVEPVITVLHPAIQAMVDEVMGHADLEARDAPTEQAPHANVTPQPSKNRVAVMRLME